ncbi:MAG: ATP-grasp domain-containing protein [Phycisphaerae bacterium]
MRKLQILVLVHKDFVPPETIEGLSEEEIEPWKTEYDVVSSLQNMGHDTHTLGVEDELKPLRDAITEWRPQIVFNLLEEFRGLGTYVPYILGYLELMRQAYTGCNPRGMMLATSKALQRKVYKHHRILAPDFFAVARGRTIKRPRRLGFPLIVKSGTEHGSVGISQASIVHDDEKLKDRVAFIHEQVHSDAIVEQFIEGRELYVGVIGNERLRTLPVWEMIFDNLPEGAPRIATSKIKWDAKYQKKVGLKTHAAKDIPDGVTDRIMRVCKRAYRALGQSGYARMDLRLTENNEIYLLESNPNPQLAYDEDFAESAHAVGIDFEQLLERIIRLGLNYHSVLI